MKHLVHACKVTPSKEGDVAPLRGECLGDVDAVRARIEGVKNQTKSIVFLNYFDSFYLCTCI